MKAQIEIATCHDCPYVSIERDCYEADSFNVDNSYYCTKVPSKKDTYKVIRKWVSWSDTKVSIPSWCPIKVKE